MAIIKCKMCGGDLDINQSITVGTCQYCGSTMTIPSKTDEIIINLYNRANHFRRNNEFDKAAGVYESILNQDATQAEAYWGLVLCKYGIEYVEDPKTFKRIPTCHRTRYGSILMDPDYRAAQEYADPAAQVVYETEAKVIDGIQKQILDISSKEDPFDVFICYKETNEAGTRTPDSVLAQELYHHLIKEGFKVFFSRITLEDKLGTAYEPYIFAALNSAKVMVVLGTKPEYINAVWVKNEWKRYLAMIKEGEQKTLIPAYRDMDPYDLPEEFLHLQAQDMAKLGFMQDLIRGIKKLLAESLPGDQNAESAPIRQPASGVTPLLERAFLCLEMEEYKKADDLLEQVLNLDPKNATAYIGKLMVELKTQHESDLQNGSWALSQSKNYQMALRFADHEYQQVLTGYNQAILDRLEIERKEKIYQEAFAYKNQGDHDAYQHAAKLFSDIVGYKDANALAAECERLAKEIVYQRAMNLKRNSKNDKDYLNAAQIFRRVEGYKDASALAEECDQLGEAIRKQDEKRAVHKKKIKNITLASIFILFVLAVVLVLLFTWILPTIRYNQAANLFAEKQHLQAAQIFADLDNFRDSQARERESYYYAAINLKDSGNYEEAIIYFNRVGSYADATLQIQENYYYIAIDLKNSGNYEEAIVFFNAAGSYVDATLQIQESNYLRGLELRHQEKLLDSIEYFLKAGNYADAKLQLQESYYRLGLELFNEEKFCNANMYFMKAGECGDARDRVMQLTPFCRNLIAAGHYHTVALEEDGTVLPVGRNGYGQLNVAEWRDIVAVSAGANHTVGLKGDGTVLAVGNNDDGQLNVTEWRDIVAASAGAYHTVGLKGDGTVLAVGDNDDGQLNVAEWRDIVAVSAGANHTVGLKGDGTVLAVGNNDDGQLNVTEWRDIVAMSAGACYTIGLKRDGTVLAVGRNGYGQLNVAEWRDIVAVSASAYHTVGLKGDGTVLAVGWNNYGQLNVTEWRDIVAVLTSYNHTVGLMADGTVLAVGWNKFGQLNVTEWNLFD